MRRLAPRIVALAGALAIATSPIIPITLAETVAPTIDGIQADAAPDAEAEVDGSPDAGVTSTDVAPEPQAAPSPEALPGSGNTEPEGSDRETGDGQDVAGTEGADATDGVDGADGTTDGPAPDVTPDGAEPAEPTVPAAPGAEAIDPADEDDGQDDMTADQPMLAEAPVIEDTVTTSVSADLTKLSMSTKGSRIARASNVAFEVRGKNGTTWINGVRAADGSWSAPIDTTKVGEGAYTCTSWATIDGKTSSIASTKGVISSLTANVTASWDAATSSFTVTARDVVRIGGVGNLALRASMGSKTAWYDMTPDEAGAWSVKFPASDLGGKAGGYEMTVYVNDASGRDTLSMAPVTASASFDDSVSASVSADLATLQMSTKGSRIANASNVAFEVRGANGTTWINGVKASDGSWSVPIATSKVGEGAYTCTSWATIDGKTSSIASTNGTIGTLSATVTATWDAGSASFTVKASDVIRVGGVGNLALRASNGSKTAWYDMTPDGAGAWSVKVSLHDFADKAGTYTMTVYVNDASGRNTKSASPITATSSFDDTVTTSVSDDLATLQMSTSGSRIARASNVAFEVRGKNGTTWINGVKASDGSWSAPIATSKVGEGAYTCTSWATIDGKTSSIASAKGNVGAAVATTVVGWDNARRMITVDITDVKSAEGVRNLAVCANVRGGSAIWLDATPTAAGTYHAEFSPARFSWADGNYSVSTYVADNKGKAHNTGTETYALSYGGQAFSFDVQNNATTDILTITAKGGVIQIASNVAFCLSSSNGTNWIQAQKESDGSWSFKGSLASNAGAPGSCKVTAWATVDGKSYQVGSETFTNAPGAKWMTAKVQSYSSATNWLIAVDTSGCFVGVYRGSYGNWNLTYLWPCSPGAWSTPTPTGTYSVGYKGLYFDSGINRCWYYTSFYGAYMFHSVLYAQTSSPSTLLDGRTGLNLSHGCVRLAIDNAKWIYDNIPSGTKVISY